ncbi:hypothetical protein ACFXGI_27730 [Streptomyces sp. NPDC059355]|uniref:hypothetical protein n=1 Tax=Streptomyces sp. NPDC059355 TaxID=3346811 RepID=UPI00369B68D2
MEVVVEIAARCCFARAEGGRHVFERHVAGVEFVRGVLAGLGDDVFQVGEGLQRDQRLAGGQEPVAPGGRRRVTQGIGLPQTMTRVRITGLHAKNSTERLLLGQLVRSGDA